MRLKKCEAVIRDVVRGRLNDDFADEFGSFWSSVNSLVDLPANAIGKASVKYIRFDSRSEPIPVLAKDSSRALVSRSRCAVKGQGESAFIVRRKPPSLSTRTPSGRLET